MLQELKRKNNFYRQAKNWTPQQRNRIYRKIYERVMARDWPTLITTHPDLSWRMGDLLNLGLEIS